MVIVEWVGPLGGRVIRQIHAQEITMEHGGGCEDKLRHVISIGEATCLFNEQAQQHIAAVTVATSLARREIGGLVRKLREKVSGLGNSIVGSGLPEIGVHLPALFLSIIRDTRGMRQQLKEVDGTRYGCLLQSQENEHRGIEGE